MLITFSRKSGLQGVYYANTKETQRSSLFKMKAMCTNLKFTINK